MGDWHVFTGPTRSSEEVDTRALREKWTVAESNTSKHIKDHGEATTRKDQVRREELYCYLLYNGIILGSSANRVLVLSATKRRDPFAEGGKTGLT